MTYKKTQDKITIKNVNDAIYYLYNSVNSVVIKESFNYLVNLVYYSSDVKESLTASRMLINYYEYEVKDMKQPDNLMSKELITCCEIVKQYGDANDILRCADILYNTSKKQYESKEYYKTAADKGSVIGAYIYANMCYNNKFYANKSTNICTAKLFKIVNTINAMLTASTNNEQNNEKESIKYYKQAAEGGHIDAMCCYINLVKKGKRNDKQIIKYCDIIAENGNFSKLNNDSLHYYANYLYENNEKEKAAKYYKIAADNGSLISAYNYAVMCYEGDGIEINSEEAVKYYKIASEDKTNKEALERYYFMTHNDNDEEININKQQKAATLKMNADNGDYEAAYMYFIMLDQGDGIYINKKEAVKYLKIAVNGGYADAIYHYAVKINSSSIFMGNGDKAEDYYRMDVDKGNIRSIPAYLNILYESMGEDNLKNYLRNYLRNKNETDIYNILDKYINYPIFNRKIFDMIAKEYNSNNISFCLNIGGRKIINNGIIDEFSTSLNGENKKVYKIEYIDDGKIITYFDENGNEIITANIDNKGTMKFNFNNNCGLEEKINNIFANVDNTTEFDSYLSYLAYAPLQLQLQDKASKDKVIFNINCNDNTCNDHIRVFLNTINNSLEERDKTFICDFGIDEHVVQMVISNGKIAILNTGMCFNYLIERIKKRFYDKFGEDKEIDIVQCETIMQKGGSCVIASKFYASELIKNWIKQNNKLNTLPARLCLLEKIKKYKQNNEEFNIQKKRAKKISTSSLNKLKELFERIEEVNFLLVDTNDKYFSEVDNDYSMLRDYFYSYLRHGNNYIQEGRF